MDHQVREIDESSRNTETVTAGADDSAGENRKSIESLPNTAIIHDAAAETEREDACSSCSIAIDGDGDVGENQKVCRICHLTAKENGNTSVELIELGCRCKGELGVAHSHCAEAWFRVKGNRSCEICGEAARNVTGVGDNGFMEEWNERSIESGDNGTSDGSRRCLHGQPLCNLLMSFLVIAFVLPWFFRVNMF